MRSLSLSFTDLKHTLCTGGGFRRDYEEAVKGFDGMGITASLACSHVKGKS